MKSSVTKSELEILQVMWGANKPVTRGDILALSDNKHWKDNSIHILLNSLLEKGLIQPSGFTRSGKVWGRLYEPLLTPENYYKDVFHLPVLNPLWMLEEILFREDVDSDLRKQMLDMLNNH